MTDKLTADVISNKTTGIVTSPEDGEEFEAVYQDITTEEQQRLEELEGEANQGDEDAAQELQRLIVEEYLIEPDLSVADLGIAWRQAIVVGFMKALGDNQAVQEAQDMMDTVEGNR